MDKQKVLIVGSNHGPSFHKRLLMDSLIAAGINVEYMTLQFAEALANSKEDLLVQSDFSKLEERMTNAMMYGMSHPEIFTGKMGNIEGHHLINDAFLIDPQPSPDKRKGPKGPRNRWGKIR